jgi:hypothetical protein
MRFTEPYRVRFTKKQMDTLSKLAAQSGMNRADVVRRAIEIMGSEDHVVVPLTVKERLFIEGICNTAGVQPSDAVKIVLLSYHTLMSAPLWRIVKPVDEVLEEMEGNGDE